MISDDEMQDVDVVATQMVDAGPVPESLISQFAGRWIVQPGDHLLNVTEDGTVMYEDGQTYELQVSERGCEFRGYLADLNGATGQKMSWTKIRVLDEDCEQPEDVGCVEWHRPVIDLTATDDEEEEHEPLGQEQASQNSQAASQILIEAGASLGKSEEQMKPLITRIVEENWHETEESLRKLTPENWEKMNVPGALVRVISERLNSQETSASQPPVKRPRLFEQLVHKGDLLEGLLRPSAKKAMPMSFSLFVASVDSDAVKGVANLGIRVTYRTNVPGVSSCLVTFDAHGSYDLRNQKLDVEPTAVVEPLDDVRVFRFTGRFDKRWRNATLIGNEVVMLKSSPRGFLQFNGPKFDEFQASVKSSTKSRTTVQLTPAEQAILVKLDETIADRSIADRLVKTVRDSLESFSLSALPMCEKWRKQLDEISVSGQGAPNILIRGPTGSGKSYLNNAICGIPDFCPSDCSTGRAVTATTIGVANRPWTPRRSDGTSEWLLHTIEGDFVPSTIEGLQETEAPAVQISADLPKRYGARIQLYTAGEWKDEKMQHVKTLVSYWIEERQDSVIKKQRPSDMSDSGGAEAWDKLAAVYGRDPFLRGRTKSWPDEEALVTQLASLEASNPVIRKLNEGSDKIIEENDLECYKRKMKHYQRTDTDSSGPQFWPVVKRLTQFAPIERLRGLGELVDSVGSGDSNAARNAIAQHDENSADAVLIVVDIARCVNNQVGIEILQNQMRYSLMKCNADDLAFVCTKADVMNEREVTQTMRLPANSTFSDCVRARNALVKASMTKEMQQMIADMGDQEKDFSWFKPSVFTVSTKCYMANLGLESFVPPGQLSDLESEVPAVIHHLQLQALKWHNRAAAQQMLALAELAQAMHSQLSAGESPEEQKRHTQAIFEPLFASFKHDLKEALWEFWRDRMVPAIEDDIQECVFEGQRKAEGSAPVKANQWKNYHPSTYKAAMAKEGIHPTSTKGAIHWPNELSSICYDSFQPQWMELFGTLLPELLHDLTDDTVQDLVNTFHDQLAEALPSSGKLAGLRQGIKIDLWLRRQRLEVDYAQRAAQKDLSDEVVKALKKQMKVGFVEAKDPSICKGKGCVQRLKDHMDRFMPRIRWETTTAGLIEGLGEMKESINKMISNIEKHVPEMIYDGYKVLWEDLDEDALKQWQHLCVGMSPVIAEVKTSAAQLLARLRERESMSQDKATRVDTCRKTPTPARNT